MSGNEGPGVSAQAAGELRDAPAQQAAGEFDDTPAGERKAALLLIDLINDFDFDQGEVLLAQTRPVAERVAGLKRRAKAAGMPVVYVNDNFGQWKSDLRAQVDRCLSGGRAKEIVELLKPGDDDYFVLKPKHSGFFATPLELLLNHLNVNTLVITGVAGNICVLFTANDAYMHDYTLYVPEDCTASNDPEINAFALEQMRLVLKADTTPSNRLDLAAIQHSSRTHAKERNRRSLMTPGEGGGRQAKAA